MDIQFCLFDRQSGGVFDHSQLGMVPSYPPKLDKLAMCFKDSTDKEPLFVYRNDLRRVNIHEFLQSEVTQIVDVLVQEGEIYDVKPETPVQEIIEHFNAKGVCYQET